MKIYSDVLDYQDLHRALVTAETAPGERLLYFERYDNLPRPRLRKRGWSVLLGRMGSRRRFNTGCYGAGERGAASRDDWGRFLAALYERDPDMRAGNGDGYTSRDDFHTKTGRRYLEAVTA